MSQAERSDEDLVAGVRQGSAEDFACLVKRHADRFYGLAWRVSSGQVDCEDIVQDAFLKLWQAPEKFDPAQGVRFTTWFYRVVANLTIDRLRDTGKTSPIQEGHLAPVSATVETEIMITQEQQALEEAIQRLPERQKLALTLCFYEGLSNKEAAGIMEIGVKALESLLMRAKAALKEDMFRRGMMEKEAGHG